MSKVVVEYSTYNNFGVIDMNITKKIIACLLAIFLLTGTLLACAQQKDTGETKPTKPVESTPDEPPAPNWQMGYVSTSELTFTYHDENGATVGTLTRGTPIQYEPMKDGRTKILVDDTVRYLTITTNVVADPALIIPDHTLFIRSAVNLRTEEGRLLKTLAQKGSAVDVIGYDYLDDAGKPHMYKVKLGEEEGYVMPWYLVDNEEDALANYDDGDYATHAARGNWYGGGTAANLDYFPRDKYAIEGNVMPDECRCLYLVNWRLGEVDSYINLAKNTGINAFVVDIADGSSIGFAGDVMYATSPTSAKYAQCKIETYQNAIKKLKDAGFYVIGRLTTFNDTLLIKDHPEFAITDLSGYPLRLNGEYWPTAFNRTVWQYKVDLAVEAVELMGFNEIQFDYVRFPDLTWSYDNAGTIDYHNTYGESKAQAIQRFLMYATDILREHGAYVSADVFGESAFTYVTSYGQYWPAISNVVDAISGMPYPDHFGADGDYKPWEHPYNTLYNWGCSAVKRQSETATPAAIRTWIQAYNAIRAPYNFYGTAEIAAQVKGLRDAGCTGGFMPWNPSSSMDKYRLLLPAFAAP